MTIGGNGMQRPAMVINKIKLLRVNLNILGIFYKVKEPGKPSKSSKTTGSSASSNPQQSKIEKFFPPGFIQANNLIIKVFKKISSVTLACQALRNKLTTMIKSSKMMRSQLWLKFRVLYFIKLTTTRSHCSRAKATDLMANEYYQE